METETSVSKQDLLDSHARIRDFIHATPVLTSRHINEVAGAEIGFKCENLQRTGSFKMRGATNAIMSLSKAERDRGVVAHSSGNFAQAVALAARITGVPAWIVMPDNAPRVKMQAVRGYGGQVIECQPTLEARQAAADRIVEESGATFLHPSNDLNVILGQATAAMELLNEWPGPDCLVTPVGGGGLLAGCSLAVHYFSAQCTTVAGEPMAVDDAFRSLASGKIETNESAQTIADGLRTNLGDINFPIIQKYVDRIIRVGEDEIVAAMRLIWERMKMVVEPSSAVALAAVLRDREAFVGKKVGVILTGGNVDLGQLPF